MLTIPPEVAHQLGYYVYLYIDPRNNCPFYVGKGCGDRVLAHLSATDESREVQVLNELKVAGREPILEILSHKLDSEKTAFRVEAAVIDVLGLGNLTNEVRGWKSVQLGRLPLSELIIYYAAKPTVVTHPALLIRINRLYRHGMSAEELYETTRGVWKVGPRRERAKYAFAVFERVVREVYEIEQWHPAGTTPYKTRPPEAVARPGRWEFVGHVATSEIRDQYVGRSVAAEFPKSAQSPVVYKC